MYHRDDFALLCCRYPILGSNLKGGFRVGGHIAAALVYLFAANGQNKTAGFLRMRCGGGYMPITSCQLLPA